jgi:hypothetical protein
MSDMGDSVGNAQGPGQVTLRLGEAADLRICVSKVQYLSVLAMVADSVAGIHRGLPAAVRHRVASAVSPAGHRALRPIGAGPSVGWTPDCLIPFSPGTDVGLESALGELRGADPGDVGANLAAEFGESAPPPWRPAMDDPRDWIVECGEALEQASAATSPLWRVAQHLLDREVERVGVATVRGGTRALLGNLNSRISCDESSLHFSHAVAGSYDLAGRALILVPLMSGDEMVVANFESPDHVWVGYAMPGLGNIWNPGTGGPPSTDPLVNLLGVVAAGILVDLARPATMGELVTVTASHPNKVTRCCDRLVAAGLVERHRHGRTVRVNRTELGTHLLDLYR